MLVAGDEVGAQDRAEELGGSHRVLFSEDEGGVFDGVGCDDDAVVGLGVAVFVSLWVFVLRDEAVRVRFFNLAVNQTSDGGLDHGLDIGLIVADDLKQTDVVLAVAATS